MKNLLVGIAALAVAVLALGIWQGWFEFGAKKEDGQRQLSVNVNLDKFKQDKADLKKLAAEKAKAVRERLAHLKDKGKDLAGEEKARHEKEVEDLAKKEKDLDAKQKEIEDATEEGFEKLKSDVNKAGDK